MMPLGWNRAVTTQETSLSEKKKPAEQSIARRAFVNNQRFLLLCLFLGG